MSNLGRSRAHGTVEGRRDRHWLITYLEEGVKLEAMAPEALWTHLDLEVGSEIIFIAVNAPNRHGDIVTYASSIQLISNHSNYSNYSNHSDHSNHSNDANDSHDTIRVENGEQRQFVSPLQASTFASNRASSVSTGLAVDSEPGVDSQEYQNLQAREERIGVPIEPNLDPNFLDRSDGNSSLPEQLSSPGPTNSLGSSAGDTGSTTDSASGSASHLPIAGSQSTLDIL